MQKKVYFPIRCRNCGKSSAIPFGRIDLANALDERLPIELMCSFDRHSWNATAQERVALVKLLEDTAGNEHLTPTRFSRTDEIHSKRPST